MLRGHGMLTDFGGEKNGKWEDVCEVDAGMLNSNKSILPDHICRKLHPAMFCCRAGKPLWWAMFAYAPR